MSEGQAFNDPLEDLYTEALLNRKQRPVKSADPSARNALDAAAKKMREMYTLPENWEAGQGIALIDKQSKTLIGVFREYKHKTAAGTRKLIREHNLINVDHTEEVEGYIGENLEQRLRGRSWSEQHRVAADVWLDEMMVGCPKVQLNVCLHLGAVVRIELEDATQFASQSGTTFLQLPKGTDIFHAMSQDSKTGVRKQVSL